MKEKNIILFNNLPTVNFILIILIIFIHSYNANAYGLNYHGWDGSALIIEDIISQGIAHIATPLFFTISGILMFSNLDYRTYSQKILRRKSSLLFPYLIWNIIYMFLFVIISNINFISTRLNSDFDASLSISNIIAGIFFHKYNYIMWFIYQLMIYHLLSIIFIPLFRRLYWGLAIIIIPAILYSTGLKEIPSSIIILGNHIEGIYTDMFFYYLFGGIIGANIKNTLTVFSHKWMPFFWAMLCSWIILWIFNRIGYKEWRYDSINLICNTIGIIAILLLSANIEFKNFFIPVAPFLIFAVHPFLLEVFQKINYIIFPHTPIFAIMDYFVSVIITVILVILLGRFSSKYIPSIYSILLGKR